MSRKKCDFYLTRLFFGFFITIYVIILCLEKGGFTKRMENLMTCTAAAKRVGITKGTVSLWMKRGLITPKMVVGPCLLIDVTELSQVARQLREQEARGSPRLG